MSYLICASVDTSFVLSVAERMVLLGVRDVCGVFNCGIIANLVSRIKHKNN
jgi:hypothetical protein